MVLRGIVQRLIPANDNQWIKCNIFYTEQIRIRVPPYNWLVCVIQERITPFW